MRDRSPAPRRYSAGAGPVLVIVLGALGVLVHLCVAAALSIFAGHPIAFLIALGFGAIVAGAGVLYVRWLDAWEPEPMSLLWAAFLWGAGISLAVAEILTSPVNGAGTVIEAYIASPISQELVKCLFLIVVLLATRQGRAEVNSLVDLLVCAAMVGTGFAFSDHLKYVLAAIPAEGATGFITFLVLGSFSQAVFVSATAIGIWAGLQRRGAKRWAYWSLGLGAAMGMHILSIASAAFGMTTMVVIKVVVDIGGLVAVVIVGVRARRAEGRTVQEQLPQLVAEGLVPERVARVAATLGSRRKALRSLPPAVRPQLEEFFDDLTSLAMARQRTTVGDASVRERARVEADQLTWRVAAWRAWSERQPGWF